MSFCTLPRSVLLDRAMYIDEPVSITEAVDGGCFLEITVEQKYI